MLLFANSLLAQADAVYNASLADSLGADKYGMKSYVFVILKIGSNTTANDNAKLDAFLGDMQNIRTLVDQDKLVLAGPFCKNDKNYRGLFIFDVKTIEEADALLATDPAVKLTLLNSEMFQCYGSAALPAYLDTHKLIEKVRP